MSDLNKMSAIARMINEPAVLLAHEVGEDRFNFLAADTMLARDVVIQVAYQYLISTLQFGSKVVLNPANGSVTDVFGVVRSLGTAAGCLRYNGLVNIAKLTGLRRPVRRRCHPCWLGRRERRTTTTQPRTAATPGSGRTPPDSDDVSPCPHPQVRAVLTGGRSRVRTWVSDADLAWETELLKHLDRNGLTVPVPLPTTDGRLFADGMVVMTYLEGGPPETAADWRRVADTLRQLHRLTQGWPQRPGWRSSTDLLHAATGTRIDLNAMPPEGVGRCRAAWARLIGRQTCVVHGDPDNLGNVRMTTVRVALIDWDETHVDVPDLDLVLPHNAAGLDSAAHDIAAQAKAAWDAAVCWDDEYSIKRLAEVRAA